MFQAPNLAMHVLGSQWQLAVIKYKSVQFVHTFTHLNYIDINVEVSE